MPADKREAIIGAALHTFARNGVDAATMNQIAGGLGISKALLYYYFPDKMSLYAAALEQVIRETTERHSVELAGISDPMAAFDRYLEFRTEFILKHYQLLEYLKGFDPRALPAPLVRLFEPLRQVDLDRIRDILELGCRQGLFHIPDTRHTATLFFEFLEGARFASTSRQANSFPDRRQFSALLRREKEFARIFLRGLTVEE